MASIMYRSPWLLASKRIRSSAQTIRNSVCLKTAAFSSRPAYRIEQLDNRGIEGSSISGVEHKNLDPRTEPVGAELSQTFANPPPDTQPELPDTSSTDRLELTKVNADEVQEDDKVRWPRAVQAVFLKPLRREIVFGHPSCDLQIRSYSVRNLDFFSDFALRAAYYLKLPAFGPVPLPRIVERWTVPKSNFVHKKSQENFERRTVRRLIQIKDGHPDTVELWLSYLRKHAFHGIGMKANMYTFGTYNPPKPPVLKENNEIAASPQTVAIPPMSPGISPMTAKLNNATKLNTSRTTRGAVPKKAILPTPSNSQISRNKSAKTEATKAAATSRPADRTNTIQAKPKKPTSDGTSKSTTGARTR